MQGQRNGATVCLKCLGEILARPAVLSFSCQPMFQHTSSSVGASVESSRTRGTEEAFKSMSGHAIIVILLLVCQIFFNCLSCSSIKFCDRCGVVIQLWAASRA